MAKAEEIYKNLKAAGVEVVIDDRKERAGVKFKDADLIGYPLRIVLGPKTVENGEMEVKIRRTGEVQNWKLDCDYVNDVKALLKNL